MQCLMWRGSPGALHCQCFFSNWRSIAFSNFYYYTFQIETSFSFFPWHILLYFSKLQLIMRRSKSYKHFVDEYYQSPASNIGKHTGLKRKDQIIRTNNKPGPSSKGTTPSVGHPASVLYGQVRPHTDNATAQPQYFYTNINPLLDNRKSNPYRYRPVNLPRINDTNSLNSTNYSGESGDGLENGYEDPAASSIAVDDENTQIANVWAQSLPLDRLPHNALLDLKATLRVPTRIKTDTMIAFNVCALPDRDGLIFPRYLPGRKTPVGIRVVRQLPETGNVVEEIIPRVKFGGLFGYNVVLPAHKEIVLTTSDIDAMAVYQETHIPALVVDDKRLGQDAQAMLDDFDKIHIWFPPNLWSQAKIYAQKLLWSRCHLIKPGNNPGSPAAVLQDGGHFVTETVRKSEPLTPHGLLTFQALRADILDDFRHKDQHLGAKIHKWQRHQKLTIVLKGFRMGELTILTGPTGSGKTTFLSEYALDLCEQGVRTLWGSWDISSQRLARVMLKQYARMDLENHIEKFDYWADKFSQLPLLFMNFHGASDVRKLVEGIERAIKSHEIQHIVLDNIQFVGSSHDSTEKFRVQDEIVGRFRRLATERHVHVTLVLAPRKETPSEEVSVGSLHNGEKAFQEADNVLVIQQVFLKEHPFLKKYLQVLKNRFDGELELSDRCAMAFERKTNCFTLRRFNNQK